MQRYAWPRSNIAGVPGLKLMSRDLYFRLRPASADSLAMTTLDAKRLRFRMRMRKTFLRHQNPEPEARDSEQFIQQT